MTSVVTSEIEKNLRESSITQWLRGLHYDHVSIATTSIRISGICGDVVLIGKPKMQRIWQAKQPILRKLLSGDAAASSYWVLDESGRKYREFYCRIIKLATVPNGGVFLVPILSNLAKSLEEDTPHLTKRLIVFFGQTQNALYPIGFYRRDTRSLKATPSALCFSLPIWNDKTLNTAFSQGMDAVNRFQFFESELFDLATYGYEPDHPTTVLLKKLGLDITPERLTEAIETGSSDQVKTILSIWTPPNITDDATFRPLNSAVAARNERDNHEIVRLLLKAGCDPELRDDDKDFGFSSLHFAAMRGDFDSMKLLVKAGVSADETYTPLPNASSVLANSISGTSPLHFASANACVDIVDCLIDAGASTKIVSRCGESALHWAAGISEFIFQVLLERKANYRMRNLQGATALHLSAAGVKNDIMRCGVVKQPIYNFELGRGNFRPDTAKIARLCIEVGIDVDDLDSDENTPLHWASTYGNDEVTRALIDAGCNAYPKNAKGFHPIDIALNGLHAKIIGMLLQTGSPIPQLPPEFSDYESFLIAHVNRKKCLEVAELLDENGLLKNQEKKKLLFEKIDLAEEERSLLNIETDDIWRSLSETPMIKIIDKLLSAEAEIDARNVAGNTPLLISAGGGILVLRNRGHRFAENFWRKW